MFMHSNSARVTSDLFFIFSQKGGCVIKTRYNQRKEFGGYMYFNLSLSILLYIAIGQVPKGFGEQVKKPFPTEAPVNVHAQPYLNLVTWFKCYITINLVYLYRNRQIIPVMVIRGLLGTRLRDSHFKSEDD